MRKIDYWLLTQTGWLNELLYKLTGRSFGYELSAKRWVLSRSNPRPSHSRKR